MGSGRQNVDLRPLLFVPVGRVAVFGPKGQKRTVAMTQPIPIRFGHFMKKRRRVQVLDPSQFTQPFDKRSHGARVIGIWPTFVIADAPFFAII